LPQHPRATPQPATPTASPATPTKLNRAAVSARHLQRIHSKPHPSFGTFQMSHSVTSVLSQIRTLQTQMGQSAVSPLTEAPKSNAIQGLVSPQEVQGPSFTETLRGAIAGVNEAQQKSGALAKSFELGEPGADLAKVMVASQQSQIAFRATVEVRNRLVQAYQDVMNMPL
jgi:flagellar hook-basal body complex protein FliE